MRTAPFTALALLLAADLAAQRPKAAPNYSAIDPVLTAMMAEWKVPGLAVGIVHNGKEVYAKGYGLRDVEKQLPVTPRTIFAIGSNTKSFTAALLAMLVEQGKLDWDTPVNRYLPDFQMYDEYATKHLTPRDLVTHRSGLPRHDLVWYGRNRTRRELFDRLRFLEPSVSFRDKWQYQNLMFMTAGYLTERLWGRPWEDLIKAEIFAPLGMSRSNVSVRESPAADDYALPYQLANGAVSKVAFRDLDAMGPAGSINSSIDDMLKYVQFRLNRGQLDGKRLLSDASEHQLQSGQMAIQPGAGEAWPGFDLGSYALGLVSASYRGHRVVLHGGGIDGFISQMSWMPDDNAGVVVLSNLSPDPVPMIAVQSIYDRILGLTPIDWSAKQRLLDAEAAKSASEAAAKRAATRKTGTSPSHPLADFVGRYQHPGYGTIEVTAAGSGLTATLDKFVVPLVHWHYDTFDATDPGNIVPLSGLVSFLTNAAGRVEALTMPLEPNVAPIRFVRVPTN